MAEKSKAEKAEDTPEPSDLPGSPEWERNRQVIHGEVDPRDPAKADLSREVEGNDPDDKKD